MLSDHIEFAGILKGRVLDSYLEKGWYRTGSLIFTTHFLAPYDDERQYRVYWLRYIVKELSPSAKLQQLYSRNRHFTISCRAFELTPEVDTLHKAYSAATKFDSCKDLETLLMDTGNCIYDSYIIELRDKGRLIAAGIFDKGYDTIQGIINFYDPAYKKYSLGKYLVLLKYLYCLANNIGFYYPGYYMPEQPIFDYKLFLDKSVTEVYLPEEDVWIPFNGFTP